VVRQGHLVLRVDVERVAVDEVEVGVGREGVTHRKQAAAREHVVGGEPAEDVAVDLCEALVDGLGRAPVGLHSDTEARLPVALDDLEAAVG
jgi:hypothetical protein